MIVDALAISASDLVVGLAIALLLATVVVLALEIRRERRLPAVEQQPGVEPAFNFKLDPRRRAETHLDVGDSERRAA